MMNLKVNMKKAEAEVDQKKARDLKAHQNKEKQ